MTKFTPPTIEEVRAYIVEKNYNLDAKAFWLSYEQKGWKVGKNKMQKWRASVSLWARMGWGKTAKSTQEFTRRNQSADDYHRKAREDYGEFLRAKTTMALEDMSKDPGNVPLWLIKEILKERHNAYKRRN